MPLSGKKYKVDYCGRREDFNGAEDSYAAGERVEFYFNFIATDISYSFFADGKEINPDFSIEKGFIISFIMPGHDITFRVKERNMLLFTSDINTESTLSFDSFEGGGPEYRVKIDDEAIASYNTQRKYFSEDHDELCGAGYTVKIEFIGLKKGKTKATVECRSPIADNFDALYEIEVDEALNVRLTELERKDILNQ